LGRTARAGKKGHGLLILSDIEQGFLHTLNGLDIPVDEDMQKLVDSSPSEAVKKELDPVLESIHSGKNKTLVKSAQDAYRGMMGFYNGQLKRIGVRSTDRVIQFVNSFALQTGLSEVPGISVKSARSMGIYGLAGLHYHLEDKSGSVPRGRPPSGGKSIRKRESVGSRKSSNRRPGSW
jgi:ATP-dependent RNA helicase MSS116